MQAPKHKACHDEWDDDCKIFVGGLGEEGTRIELEDSFSKFGPIKNIWLAKAPPSFAYIEMAVRKFTIWLRFCKIVPVFCTEQDPRDAEDAVKSLHRTEICGMRATVKMAREKEEERAQARDRMLREEMAKKKAKMEAENARRGGTYRTRDDFERPGGSSGSSSHRDKDYGRGRNCLEEKDSGRDRRDDRRDYRDERDSRRERDYRDDRDRRDYRDDRSRRDYRDDRDDRRDRR